MRVIVGCAIVASALGCSRGERSRVAVTDSAPARLVPAPDATIDSAPKNARKELSPSMQSALDTYSPGFQLFALSEYTPQVAEYAKPPQSLPLNQAAGDFNGDGVPDLALHGHDQTRELVVVLLSRGDSSYQAIPLAEFPLYHSARGNDTFIAAQPPGPLEIPEGLEGIDTPPPPATLPHGGVSLVADAQASQLFYWNGSRFVGVTTGD
jgi:hypothetical protein